MPPVRPGARDAGGAQRLGGRCAEGPSPDRTPHGLAQEFGFRPTAPLLTADECLHLLQILFPKNLLSQYPPLHLWRLRTGVLE